MKKTEQKVIKYIDENELIQQGDKILVALSGGPDSVFLLHFLNKFKKRFRINIGAYHLNHKLRKQADSDQNFCKKLCGQLKIPFYHSSSDVNQYAAEKKISIEEAGRLLRYQALGKYALEGNFNKIATAHNAGDNAETVLLNLIKGTGLKGISGIPVKRDNIIRPVLVLTKEEILDYLVEFNYSFRIDKSNLSTRYERNFIRKKIIPLIKQRLNPSLENTILSSSSVFRNHYLLFEEKFLAEISSFFTFTGGAVIFYLAKIKGKTNAEISEIVKYAIERNFYTQMSFNDINRVISLINKQTGTKTSLSGSLTAQRERDEIFINKAGAQSAFNSLKIKPGEKIDLPEGSLYITADVSVPEIFPNKSFVEYISADDLKGDFILRRWQKGDRFRPLGLNGSKKVSDFLNEQKVVSSKKKNQLVLTNAGRIVWVLGLRIDERFKIKNSTKKVYQLCLK